MRLPSFVTDPVIRRKAGFSRIDLSRYELEVARTAADYEEAFRLVHVGYVFQGIERLGPLDMRINEQHVLPEATVFNAREDGRLVGTLTLTSDSPAGLCLEADYPEEIHRLREQGAILAEIGSLAIVRRCWHSGALMLLALAAVRHLVRHLDATHCVVGVHPRTASYYRAVWNFQVLGAPKIHTQLSAPVVALVVSLDDVRDHFSRYFRQPMHYGPSAYDYLFERAPWPWHVDMPEGMTAFEQTRWKMPREVFRSLFLDRSDRVRSLSPTTRTHLARRRSDATVRAESEALHDERDERDCGRPESRSSRAPTAREPGARRRSLGLGSARPVSRRLATGVTRG